ncbi:LysE family translocator [uncultured Ruegeria sp.]|uniref:LysE family translocator n=1 Tax=uncultured Ruegeria sp. TaxID=259304 RepID=UPI0026100BAA|nr:LysE family translocator [uncultured Ruegeria sp.]
MELGLILALIGATSLLVVIPGPNVALIVANTLAYGFRFGAMTVLGTTIGVALQLVIVVVGLAALLEFAASAFLWLKWIGVAYLVYLGVTAWRQGLEDLTTQDASRESLTVLFWQGLLLATINPKTLIFNAAFLPQFVVAGSGISALLVTAVIYLAVIMLGDLVWAASAQMARPVIARLGRLRHKLTGVLYFGSGTGLAIARIDR